MSFEHQREASLEAVRRGPVVMNKLSDDPKLGVCRRYAKEEQSLPEGITVDALLEQIFSSDWSSFSIKTLTLPPQQQASTKSTTGTFVSGTIQGEIEFEMFGVRRMDSVSNTFVWSHVFNIGARYVPAKKPPQR